MTLEPRIRQSLALARPGRAPPLCVGRLTDGRRFRRFAHWNKGAAEPSRLAAHTDGSLAREPPRGRSKPADRASHSGRRRVQDVVRSPTASCNPDIRSAIPGRTLLAAARSFRKPKSEAPLPAGRRILDTPLPRAHMTHHYKDRHYKNLGRCNRSPQRIRRQLRRRARTNA